MVAGSMSACIRWKLLSRLRSRGRDGRTAVAAAAQGPVHCSSCIVQKVAASGASIWPAGSAQAGANV